MVVGMISGNTSVAMEAIKKALANVPHAYALRMNFVEYLQPKWGGTYEDANRFVEDAQKYGSLNPRIWSMKGCVPSMEAYQAMLNGQFPLAIEKYSVALKSGDRLSWLKGKAYSQYMIGDYKGAIESMSKVGSYFPDNEKSAVSRVVDVLAKEDQRIPKKRPADTFKYGEFEGPLGWNDFR